MAGGMQRIFGLILGVLGACSFTIDEDELGGEPVLVCNARQKECNVEGVAQCVGLGDASFGCSRRNCIPCNLPNTTAVCNQNSGECAVGACHGTWDDCDQVASNGCEVNTSNDVDHCGKCSRPCPAKPHAEVACGSTRCYIRLCDRGYKDCNGQFDDGCEVDAMTDSNNCGECLHACDGACSAGVCGAG